MGCVVVTLMQLILLVHAAATLGMTGLIWFVQIVHYPLMMRVPADAFVDYERQHTRRTGRVVGPLMLLELGSAIILVVRRPEQINAILPWVGLVLLGAIWLSTALLQVPCHRRLERGFDASIVERLVYTNWIRTVAWSARGLIALVMIVPGRPV
jgi:hypothetical protein